MNDAVMIFERELIDGRKNRGIEIRMSSGIALVASSMTQHAASKMHAAEKLAFI